MQLDEEGVEDLVVQAFQLKLLRGRLDQGNERIATTYAITRQFGEQEWVDLKEKVSSMFKNGQNIHKPAAPVTGKCAS